MTPVVKLTSYLFAYVLGMISVGWVDLEPNQELLSNQDIIRDERDITDINNDQISLASDNISDIRVLCWIMTSKESLKGKSINVKNTWTKRCDKVLFMSDSEDLDFPAIGLNTKEGREHLTSKSMRAFQYIYDHHLGDADWFMKADDNTYVILENLRYFLSSHSATEPIYFGRPFRMHRGYNSGGAGYVLSKEALVRFGTRKDDLCPRDGGAEDVQIGHCLRNLGVKLGDARDKHGRTRFHALNPWQINSGTFPRRYHDIDAYGGPVGINTTSPYSISFHAISPEDMSLMEYFVYGLRPHGTTFQNEQMNIATSGSSE